MITVAVMLIGATLAGGLVPLFASRFREGGWPLWVAVSAGLVLGVFLFDLAPDFFNEVDGSASGATGTSSSSLARSTSAFCTRSFRLRKVCPPILSSVGAAPEPM